MLEASEQQVFDWQQKVVPLNNVITRREKKHAQEMRVIKKDLSAAITARDNALEELRETQERLRVAHLAIGRAKEKLLDSAKPFDEGCQILNEVQL